MEAFERVARDTLTSRFRLSRGGRCQSASARRPPPVNAPVDRTRARPEIAPNFLALWRGRIIASPAQMLDQIGLVARENGYRVSEQHDSGVTLAGIRTGDLVRTVNGQPVGNVDSGRRLFDAVAATGLTRFEIERDGETIVMSFPLE